jgi:hypothetical protein
VQGSQKMKSSLSNTQENNLPQHDRPAACVITQQYSSATFFSFPTHSSKGKSGALDKCYFNFLFTFFKIA